MAIITNYSKASGDIYFHHTVSEKTQDTPLLYGPESHRGFEIIYLVEGEVRYFIEGEEYLARTGDMIFVLPDEVHALQRSKDVNYERVVVSFEFNTIKEMLALGGFDVDFSVFRRESSFRRIIPTNLVKKYGIKEIMQEISSLRNSSPDFPFKFLSAIMSLNAALNKLFADESDEPAFKVSSDPVVKGAVDYINEHITEPIALDSIADALHVSKSTLCHRFRSYMNTSVNRYVATKKIYYALRLMESGLSSTEASEAVGYEHYTTFHHNYKQIMGDTPSRGKR